MAIGQDPKELPVAIVNSENPGLACQFNETYNTQCPISFGSFGMPEANEHLANFTCRYLSFVDQKIFKPVFFNNYSEALQSVEDGNTWAVVSMHEKFSQSLYDRIIDSATSSDMKTVDLELYDKSSIKVRMDVTNQHIAFTLQMKFVEAFEKFTKQLVSSYKKDLQFFTYKQSFHSKL